MAYAIVKIAKEVADQYKRKLKDVERSLKKTQTALIIVIKAAIKQRTLEAYIAAAKIIKEAQSTARALATLWKQWEESSTIVIEVIACFKAL